MDLSFFLYRRLSSFITCKIRIPGGGKLSLDDKFQVASFQDVFLDPNYWRLYTLFDTPPALVVDCGAHCGHFTALVETCLRIRFGSPATRYILIEPSARMLRKLQRNVTDAAIGDRATVIRGLVGPKTGSATLATQPKNLLVSTVLSDAEAGETVDYVDIDRIVGDRAIDLLKLDVEGSEFSFVRHNPDVLARTNNIVAEIHSNVGRFDDFAAALRRHGFVVAEPVMEMGGNTMAIFRKDTGAPVPAVDA